MRRRFGGMSRIERIAAAEENIAPLAPPIPLQQVVVDDRQLLTVPWTSFFRWILDVGSRVFLQGTHAARLEDKNDPANYRPGTWYWETDREVLYQVRIVSGEPQWVYVLGTMTGTLTPDQRPTDLGEFDAGFQFAATDTGQIYAWDGSAWVDITVYPYAVYGTHAGRVAQNVSLMADGALWCETDRNNVLYQLQGGIWWYVSGTMYGTMVPDQRPVDLGVHEGGFEFRTTDFPARHFIWSQTAWVEVTAETNDAGLATATGILTLTTSWQDIPGTSFTVPKTGRYLLHGIFDFWLAGTGDIGFLFEGALAINGVPAAAHATFVPQYVSGTGMRATVAQQWYSTITAGSIVKLQAMKNGGTGSSGAVGTATNLSALWVGA